MIWSLRSTHTQRVIALVVGVLWLAQTGVYPAIVAAAETFSGVHQVDVNWSMNHATVALRHQEAQPALHHHGLAEKFLLLNACDGQHQDHLLDAELFQSTSTDVKTDIQRVDLVSDLILPSLTLALLDSSSDGAHWVTTTEQARCPRPVDAWRSVCLLV